MKIQILAMAVLAMIFQSCATILGGSRDGSRVTNGTPPDAKVYYNGEYVGTAPCNIKVPKSAKQGNSKVEIKADGYETAVVNMTRKVSVGYTIADILCGLIPLAVDFATGNIYKPRPNRIDYNLEKKGQ